MTVKVGLSLEGEIWGSRTSGNWWWVIRYKPGIMNIQRIDSCNKIVGIFLGSYSSHKISQAFSYEKLEAESSDVVSLNTYIREKQAS